MPGSELTLVMPAESRFISTARVMAASLAAELDFSIDEIEALRMGANELIAILTECANDHDIDVVTLRYVVDAASIEVHGQIDVPSGVEAEADVLAGQILNAVVDSYEFTGGHAHIIKNRASR